MNLSRVAKTRESKIRVGFFPHPTSWCLVSPPTLAASEGLCLFSPSANNFAMKGKRKTLNASDVLSAMEEMEFQRFVAPLKEALEGIHPHFCFLSHRKDGLLRSLITTVELVTFPTWDAGLASPPVPRCA